MVKDSDHLSTYSYIPSNIIYIFEESVVSIKILRYTVCIYIIPILLCVIGNSRAIASKVFEFTTGQAYIV